MSIDISEGESGQALVQNSELVLDAFDCWPTFHDSEVVTFCIRMAQAKIGLLNSYAGI